MSDIYNYRGASLLSCGIAIYDRREIWGMGWDTDSAWDDAANNLRAVGFELIDGRELAADTIQRRGFMVSAATSGVLNEFQMDGEYHGFIELPCNAGVILVTEEEWAAIADKEAPQ
jgi:hypothetical protein